MIPMPSRRPVNPTIHTGGESSRSTSYNSEEEDSSHHEQDYSPTYDDDWERGDDYYNREVHPSDSASASNEPIPSRPRTARTPRRHRLARQEAQFPPVQAPAPHSPSVAPSEDYAVPYGQAFQAPPAHRGGYYGGGRGHVQQYAQSQASHYMGGYPAGNQMVPYGNYGPNPFSPMGSNANGASYFGNEPRPMYDMMPYQHGYYGAPQYNMPAHMSQFHLSPPQPPATEAPGPAVSPARQEPVVDLEKLRLEAQLAVIKAEENKQKSANDLREMTEHIRQEAENALFKRMDEMKKQAEENQKKIDEAREEAERAAVARIEAERKANEERARLEAEAMQRAEENARRKFEAEIKAAEERRQREQEERVRIEKAAQERLEAALKAEADAKIAAEKKAAEEMERIKLIQEEARRKAELDYLAKVEAEKEAAKRAAEAEEAARRKAEANFLAKAEADKLAAQKAAEAEEAAKRKAEADYLAKVEAEKAAAKKAAEAEEAAKKEHEALKKKLEDEAKAGLEAAKKTERGGSIKFKDAVGRKFSFPFHICQTWQGMEELIKQAFLHVELIGPQVQEGRYDLIGPDNEIILPSVWEKVVEPEWSISMIMWPVDKMSPVGPKIPPLSGRRPMVPPMPGMPRQPAMPPMMAPGWAPAGRRRSHLPDIDIVDVNPPPKPPKGNKKGNSSMLGYFAGKPAKRRSAKK